ncbi:hypothetical protein FDP25_04970 [Roseovarius sp. A21]|uniref:DoxX-like family protein n=2 Tax=Roseovarius bejariae TaxID=2576383 RepID=A0A844CVS7_9RHOB|nr:hypothetical protein [Roseovarius bejariae]
MNAALLGLVVLQLVMLTALYAGVPPHPPEATPLFGIAPFLGMALAAALAAMTLGATGAGRLIAAFAALAAAISFGPQKYLDPAFPLIWPAVLSGQVAIVTVLVMVFKRPET